MCYVATVAHDAVGDIVDAVDHRVVGRIDRHVRGFFGHRRRDGFEARGAGVGPESLASPSRRNGGRGSLGHFLFTGSMTSLDILQRDIPERD